MYSHVYIIYNGIYIYPIGSMVLLYMDIYGNMDPMNIPPLC